ncbi:hypothetical protein N2152v2_003306 [Parachlorella kessleri]
MHQALFRQGAFQQATHLKALAQITKQDVMGGLRAAFSASTIPPDPTGHPDAAARAAAGTAAGTTATADPAFSAATAAAESATSAEDLKQAKYILAFCWPHLGASRQHGQVAGDALDPQQPWKDLMKGSMGVVSTLGTFGNNDLMYKVCGTSNMKLMDVAAEQGVSRFAFIAVHDYRFPDFLLRGYFQGKRDAEQHLAQTFPDSGVALRPGFIYGSRAVGAASIPLGAIGAPLEMALKALPTRSLANIPIAGALFVPPVSVDTVAKAALTAATDPSVPAGVMDVWTIAKYA